MTWDVRMVVGGGHRQTHVQISGENEEQLREMFESCMERMFKPQLNKLQQQLYGDRNLDRKTLQNIVENNRGMGKTTAHAMKQIADAIQNPGKPVYLFNDENSCSFAASRLYIRDVVMPMIEKLGLQFMVIRHHDNTLTFEVN